MASLKLHAKDLCCSVKHYYHIEKKKRIRSPQSNKIDQISLRSIDFSRFFYSGLLRAFERLTCISDYLSFTGGLFTSPECGRKQSLGNTYSPIGLHNLGEPWQCDSEHTVAAVIQRTFQRALQRVGGNVPSRGQMMPSTPSCSQSMHSDA